MLEGRIYNFSAGPSMLPEPVLEKAQAELLNCNGSGMSVLEMSHRSKVFEEILEGAEENLRKLLVIPDDYVVLFLHGGASGVFASLPMNLGNDAQVADYIISGNFSGQAQKEGAKYLKEARIAATTESENFARIPKAEELALSKDADYVHLCWNNTIFGTTWKYIPDTGAIPLVADMSSSILSEPVDVSKFGMIYAGVQKNLAPSGLALVIVRKDLIGNAMPITPKIWDYAIQEKNDSMINTPPTFPIYFVKLVTEYLLAEGGLAAMQKKNEEKAAVLYDYLDSQEFYLATAAKEDRSLMNVCFRTKSEELDAAFVAGQKDAGFTNLKGHRLVGGMRASIYNAMPKEGVTALVDYMDTFAKKNA